MTAEETHSTPEIPDSDTRSKSSGISVVWVIPIIAALIGGWLVFESATEEKAVAEITFKDAAGLEAGKTVVKLRNVKIGGVKDVRFSDDLSSVVVTIELEGVKQKLVTDSTRFWVVKPRVGVGGVSGLDTLLSGAYIEVDPGEGGEPATRFTGLEEPQNYQLGNPGTTYLLNSDKLGSLSRGSPIKFRDINVGTVTRYKLSEDHSNVEIELFIHAPHDQYVTKSTRFWNISGLDIDVGAQGIKLNLDSVASLIAGGIAFSSGDNLSGLDQAPENTAFKLHETEKPRFEETHTFSAPMKLYFDNGVSGLEAGAPVEFKGLRLGTVVEVGAEANDKRDDILTFAIVHIEPERLPATGQSSDLDYDQRVKLVYRYIGNMVARGTRAQLKTGNLLTGKSLVTLDIFPTAEKASLEYVDGMPIMPTVPETLTGLLEQVNKIVARIEAMPLEKIGSNVDETTKSINSLVNSLNAAKGGILGVQAAEAMDELTKAARSIRSTAEYLERHPEALVKGKRPE